MIGVFKEFDKLGKRLVIILKGLPCSWNKCSYCPFYLEQGNLEEVLKVNKKILKEAYEYLRKEVFERISIFNGGSFFELPLDTVLNLSKITKGKVVDIETRPEFLSKEILLSTLKLLKAKELVVRIGFENIDDELRNKVLNKGIPQTEIFRLMNLRKELINEGIPIKMLVYVLFGIQGVSEESIINSVKEFNKMFDGVIAIKYRKYLPHHPNEVTPSENLVNYLKKNTLLIDWGVSDIWEINKEQTSK